jgi:hypothetical protein
MSSETFGEKCTGKGYEKKWLIIILPYGKTLSTFRAMLSSIWKKKDITNRDKTARTGL